MRHVLFDNWSLQEAVLGIKYYDRGIIKTNKSLICLIEAIILWDDVYRIMDMRSSSYQYDFDVMDFIVNSEDMRSMESPHLIRRMFSEYGYDIRGIPYADIGHVEQIHDYAQEIYHEIYSQRYTETVAKGALFYLALAQLFEANYYPCDRRAEFMKSESIEGLSYSFRDKPLYQIDLQAQGVVEELNRTGNSKITFTYPLLFDHVIMNSDSLDLGNLIKTALKIKSSAGVSAYRKWMNDIEDDLQNGDVRKLLLANKQVKEMSNEFFREFSDERHCAELTLTLMPPFFSVTYPFERRLKKKLHLSFIRKMTKSSLSNRTIVAENCRDNRYSV